MKKKIIAWGIFISILLLIYPVTRFTIYLVKTIKFNINHYTIGETIKIDNVTYEVISYDDFIAEVSSLNIEKLSRLDYSLFLSNNLSLKANGEITTTSLFYSTSFNNPIDAIHFQYNSSKISNIIKVKSFKNTEILNIGDSTFTSFGNYFFYLPAYLEGLDKIKEINFYNNVYVGKDFMVNNSSLNKITFYQEFYIFENAFSKCENLHSIILNPTVFKELDSPSFPSSLITNNAFSDLPNLKEIDFRLLFPGAFHNCKFDKITFFGDELKKFSDVQTIRTKNAEAIEEHYRFEPYLIDNAVYLNQALLYLNDDENITDLKIYKDTILLTSSVFPRHRNINIEIEEGSRYSINENGHLVYNFDLYFKYPVVGLIYIKPGNYDSIDLSKYDIISSYSSIGVNANKITFDINQLVCPDSFTNSAIKEVKFIKEKDEDLFRSYCDADLDIITNNKTAITSSYGVCYEKDGMYHLKAKYKVGNIRG